MGHRNFRDERSEFENKVLEALKTENAKEDGAWKNVETTIDSLQGLDEEESKQPM